MPRHGRGVPPHRITVREGLATRICSFFETRRPAQHQDRVVAHPRFSRRGARATVREVLARAIAASQH